MLVAQRQQNEIHSSKFAESKIRITYLRLSSKSASRCNDGLYTASLAVPSRLYLLEPEPCILSANKRTGTPSLAKCSCKFVASLRLGACGFPRELRKEPNPIFWIQPVHQHWHFYGGEEFLRGCLPNLLSQVFVTPGLS